MIHVDSEPGKGTALTIFLPVAPPETADDAKKRESWVEIGHTATILVVDDDERVRRTVERALGRAGHRTIGAASGPEALRAAEGIGDPIDLLLTDMVMPGMKGPELSRRLTELRPQMRTLFMTGYTEDASQLTDAVKEGAQLLRKPFTPKELLLLISRVLG
jgi:CheY-like chemotaxis protein